MTRRIFITVAEVSGDKHAAQLIRELLALDPTLIIEGIGGPEMQAAGATVHRNTVTKAAMGWRGILRAGEVYRILRWTRRHFDANRPDLWIGVDSPSMNFHFAHVAHDRKIPTLQYVAPQLWAWAIWRMKKLRKWVDRVACILPFEEKFFGEHGVNAIFVGHPLFDELPPRKAIGLEERFPNRAPVIGLLAGSRKSEAEANFPGMLAAAARIAAQFPTVTFLVPTTAGTNPVVQKLLNTTIDQGTMTYNGLAIEFGKNQFDRMIPRCDLCLTVSGTATLHVAGFGIPMIVVYHIGAIAWHVVGRWLVPTRTFALVNVLAGRELNRVLQFTRELNANQTPVDLPKVIDPVLDYASHAVSDHIVPELIPWHRLDDLSDLAVELLAHPEKLESQRANLRRLIEPLDHPGASANVARLALGMMQGVTSRHPERSSTDR